MSIVRNTHGVGNDAGMNSSVATAACVVASGDTIVVLFASQEGSGTGITISVSDTAGNSYNVLAMRNSSGGAIGCIAYCLSATGNAANVVTVTTSTAVRYKHAAQVVYDTTAGSMVFVDDDFGQSFTDVVTCAEMTGATGNSIAVAIASSTNDRTWTPGAGYTEVADWGGSASVMEQIGTAASYTPSATAASASGLVIVGALFREQASSQPFVRQYYGQSPFAHNLLR